MVNGELIRHVVVVAVLLYVAYWLSFVGVDWMYAETIEDAIAKYRETEGIYPPTLKLLEEETYVDRFGERRPYLKEIPCPRWGYEWRYDPDSGQVERVGHNRLLASLFG